MLLSALTFSVLLHPLFASAFSFSYSSPTECDPLTINWQGGTPPFYLLITPTFSTPQNLSIPATAFNAGSSSGTFTVPQLQVASQKSFLLTMSDSTGAGSGGTSALLTAGPRTGSKTCNTQPPDPLFVFSTNSALQQCRPYVFSDYGGAAQPITITGLIPLGQTFVLHPPNGAQYSWTANAKAGTQVIFIVTDAQGRTGGSTDILPIGASDDSTCINASSPSSTAGGPTASTSSSGSSSSGGPSTTKKPRPSSSSSASAVPASGGTNNGAIIGGAIAGTAIAVLALTTLGWFLYRRRNQGKRGKYDDSPRPANMQSVEHLPTAGSATDLGPSGDYVPVPYVLPPPSHDQYSEYSHSNYPQSTQNGTTSTYGAYALGRQGAPTDPRSHTPTSMFSSPHTTTSSKAAMAGQMQQAPTRFVLHTDAGSAYDGVEDEEEEEVVELPPQYASLTPAQRRASMRRAQELAASGSGSPPPPLPGHGPSSS